MKEILNKIDKIPLGVLFVTAVVCAPMGLTMIIYGCLMHYGIV